MIKMGEGHPPAGTAKSKRAWRSLSAIVATLSYSEQRLVEAETQGSSDEALSLI